VGRHGSLCEGVVLWLVLAVICKGGVLWSSSGCYVCGGEGLVLWFSTDCCTGREKCGTLLLSVRRSEGKFTLQRVVRTW
jgi:hypothetical protein